MQKKIHRIFIIVVLAVISISSCTKDDEDNKPFEDPRVKFLGTWNVNDESCNRGRYVVTITNDPFNSIQVLINNFGFSQTKYPDTAIVAGNTITLPRQLNSENWEIQGNGQYNDEGKIEWDYTMLISSDLLVCNATYIR